MRPRVALTDCNRNQLGLQSARFWDHIICLYRPAQDHITCLSDGNQRPRPAIHRRRTALSATDQRPRLCPTRWLLAFPCLREVYLTLTLPLCAATACLL